MAKDLSEKNIINVLHAAQIADADWERIGMQLIEGRALRNIRANRHGEAGLCMIDTISQWLRTDLDPSWEKLAEAVQSVEDYGKATADVVRRNAGIAPSVFSHPTSSTALTSQTAAGAVSQTPHTTEDNELTTEDLLEITDYLLELEAKHVYNLGLVLGLEQKKVKDLKRSDSFLDDVISAWLRKEDQVTKKGNPSWTVLINALKHRRVNQIGAAEKIAKDKGLA